MMKARDLMTRTVFAVHPDTPAQEIARLLLEKGISAVPVVDKDGSPLGVVSEGDLIGRPEPEREARRDWWLAILAEGEALSPDFMESLKLEGRTAKDLMTAPVVSVGQDTDAAEIAKLLHDYRIKRVPVVQDGRIVGIVSRADLLRALPKPEQYTVHHAPGTIAGALAHLDERFLHHNHSHPTAAPSQPRAPADEAIAAADFRHLVADFHHKEDEEKEAARRAATEELKKKVAEMIDEHVSNDAWRSLVHKARTAAEHGEKEFLLLRFPSQLCSDGGRAINVGEPGWPATLRGEAAEIYLRWERDLRPQGFHLAARVLDFPDGVPGDIGLLLIWGQ